MVRLPCAGPTGANSCTVHADDTSALTIDGLTGTVYDVVLHIRGVVEAKTYEGACRVGPSPGTPSPWVLGGTTGVDTRNVFQVAVSSPNQAYYLNAAQAKSTGMVPIDFQRTVRAFGGATITLSARSIHGTELANGAANGAPVTVAGTKVSQPYDGQFVQIDVESMQPEVLPARAVGAAGAALSFMDGQILTVPDAPSLHPLNVTVEAWFEFDGTDPDHDVVIGKPFGPDIADSFAIWYQQQTFNGGVALQTADDAASFAWAPVFGEWHHVAMTYDSTARQTIFFLDGVPSACHGNAAPPVYDAHPLYIGAETDGDDYLDGFWVGAIDEVRIFSRVRTPDEIWADMNTDRLGPSDGLAGEWTFDEGDGPTASDSSGNGNTAMLGSMSPDAPGPSWVSSAVPR